MRTARNDSGVSVRRRTRLHTNVGRGRANFRNGSTADFELLNHLLNLAVKTA